MQLLVTRIMLALSSALAIVFLQVCIPSLTWPACDDACRADQRQQDYQRSLNRIESIQRDEGQRSIRESTRSNGSSRIDSIGGTRNSYDMMQRDEIRAQDRRNADRIESIRQDEIRRADRQLIERTESIRRSDLDRQYRVESQRRDDIRAEEIRKDAIRSDALRADRVAAQRRADELKAESLRQVRRADEMRAQERQRIERADEIRRDIIKQLDRAKALRADEMSRIQRVEQIRKDEVRRIQRAEQIRADQIRATQRAEEIRQQAIRASNLMDARRTDAIREERLREARRIDELKQEALKETRRADELRQEHIRETRRVDELRQEQSRELQKIDELRVEAIKAERRADELKSAEIYEIQQGKEFGKQALSAARLAEERGAEGRKLSSELLTKAENNSSGEANDTQSETLLSKLEGEQQQVRDQDHERFSHLLSRIERKTGAGNGGTRIPGERSGGGDGGDRGVPPQSRSKLPGPALNPFGALPPSSAVTGSLGGAMVGEASGTFELGLSTGLPVGQLQYKQVPKPTFADGSYSNRRLDKPERFYKYHGANPSTGKKYSWITNKKYGSEKALRRELAILGDWVPEFKYMTEFEVPAETWISEGITASQGSGNEQLPGGGYQAVIENLPKTWILRRDVLPCDQFPHKGCQ